MNPIHYKLENSVFEIKNATQAQLDQMGGKAATLAKLLQLEFPVPPGLSVLSPKLKDLDWIYLQDTVEEQKLFPVAVRSSAQGEDGSEVSYAGQFKTFLNISTTADLTQAIQNCFDSVAKASSQSYATHFDREQIPMRVLVQKMISPKFSGVYFSQDPRNEARGWMIETVEGLGEKLVSAQVTPFRFFQKNMTGSKASIPAKWRSEFCDVISAWAQKVEQALDYQIDMEWAIDQEDRFWILQVRPITTAISTLNARSVLSDELVRLKTTANSKTIWDGHSFAELNGVPSELTYDLWRQAFLPGQAFDIALRNLGYAGVPDEKSPTGPLLDRVFGRSYLNLTRLEPVYFGESPYRIAANPRPHLEFDFGLLSPSMILKAPAGILRMFKVAWRVQTQRKELALIAEKSLLQDRYAELGPHQIYAQARSRKLTEQLQYAKKLAGEFTEKYLMSTFLVTLLIESTTQGILALLSKDLGSQKALEESQHFMGENLKTIASEMSESLQLAHDSSENWESFISRFGHRGLGEMDLSHPRWIEATDAVRKGSPRLTSNTQQKWVDQALHREQVLAKISSLRKPLLLQELKELEELLKLREKIKMNVMKPYADIRWSVLAWAENSDLPWENTGDAFWLTLEELEQLETVPEKQIQFFERLKERKQKAKIFKSVEVPMNFSAAELETILEPKNAESGNIFTGVSLSPGIASGYVHIVTNPESEQPDSWPENTILVAEATDPGWTPLFAKAKAVIVAKGGILSHCAIVAREMGLPAVGEILGATKIFKEGEYVWVDGIHGSIRRTN